MGVVSMIAAQAKAGRGRNQNLLGPRSRGVIATSFILTWIATAAMVMTFVATGWLVDYVMKDSPNPQALLWGPPSYLTMIAVGLISPFVMMAALWSTEVLQSRGQIREENQIRGRLVSAVFQAGPARLATQKAGDMVSLATESAEKMMLFRQGFIGDVVASFSAPILILVMAAMFVDPLSALILAVFVPLIPAVVIGFEKIYAKVSAGSRRARGMLAAAYLDAITGLTTLRLLGAAQRVAEELAARGEENRQSIMRLLKGNQLVLFVIDVAFSLGMVTVAAALALWKVSAGSISVGQAITLLGLAVLLLEPMNQVGAFFYVGMGGMASQRAISGFLGRYERVVTPTLSAPTQQTDAPSTPVVRVEDVSFSYGKNSVLRDLNLEVYRGEKVALVGPSGQGKSTLLSILKGDLLPPSGTVEVGEALPAEANGQGEDSLRAASALVLQTTWLFTGSVADNLRISAPQATEDEMWQALEQSRLADEVRALPHGLETEVGEQGMSLSGGQAQRLSLARALISGRKILLLDEPTSQVDLESERQILEAIDALGPEYTLVMVTHRRSSLARMDRILEVRNGQLHPIQEAATSSDGSAERGFGDE